MWKNMLKGILKNVYNEVKEEVADKVGEPFKKATGQSENPMPPVSEQKKPETVATAVPVENSQKKVEPEAVLEPAGPEFALECPAEDGERETFSIMTEQTYSYVVPQDEHFRYIGNSGACEIYHCYEYAETQEADGVATISFTIAAELNCKISESSAKAAYARYHGTPICSKLMTVEHPVFTHVFMFESASIYRLTYLKRIEENELLGCELYVKKNVVDDVLKGILLKEFKQFAGSCRVE